MVVPHFKRWIIASMALLLAAWPVAAQPIFNRIADTSTAIPAGTGNYTSFAEPGLSNGGGIVVFRGLGSSGQDGIYHSNTGVLSMVADINTDIPLGIGPFTSFGNTSHSVGRTAFFGAGDFDQQGIYTSFGGLAFVADTFSPIPGGTGSFTSFSPTASVSGTNVVFRGAGDGAQEGIYIGSIGTLDPVANQGTNIPGGFGFFSTFGSSPTVSGSTVAYLGFGGGVPGIYKNDGTNSMVANTSTAIPNGTGTFTDFGNPSISGNRIAFRGKGTGQDGIYVNNSGTLIRIADLTMSVPGGTGNFLSFGDLPSVSDTWIAFTASSAGITSGLYFGPTSGAWLHKVIAAGDTLDGRIVENVFLDQYGGDAGFVGFRATFTDGTEGVYTVYAVPEVHVLLMGGSGIMLSLGALVVYQRRRAALHQVEVANEEE